VKLDKDEVRRLAWAALRQAGAARFPGVEGRIPNFVGAEAAAARLAATPEWAAATVIKANPDSPQLPVRARALTEGKALYMAVPKLASDRPFWRLEPARLTVPARQAASIGGAARHGQPVALDEMEPIDMVVCGSVAVERGGARLGKGGGYSDLEFALGVESGLIDRRTVIATTVHPSQVLANGTVPLTPHDFPLDLIALPELVVRTATRLPRPTGVIDDDLDEARRSSIPALARRADRTAGR
jgi:5-formyltetrahydrofolate cyclo-ligase